MLVSSLSEAIGVLGVVKKTRQLFIVEQTRIHLDRVDGLGNFVELEVCESYICYIKKKIPPIELIAFNDIVLIQVVLREDQDLETGQKIANDLMQALSIAKDDLIDEAYIDLLAKANA